MLEAVMQLFGAAFLHLTANTHLSQEVTVMPQGFISPLPIL
jgi:hypothetical protein